MRLLTDISYGTDPQAQALDLYLPESDHFSVFVYFHGGALEGGSRKEGAVLAEYLTSKGIAVVSADYRMYPNAAYPDFIQDAAAVVAWVYAHIGAYGICERIYVGGSSAGGYLSMMLCFDKRWLAPHGIAPEQIAGFIHDAGQPTVHFNLLRERGLDSRRVIIDDSAPLYHIGTAAEYAPMLFIVSDDDLQNRYEQTMLTLSTLKHFQYDPDKIRLKVMHGGHCAYVGARDDNGESVLGKIIFAFITDTEAV